MLALFALLLQGAAPVVHQVQIGPGARHAIGSADLDRPAPSTPFWRADHRGSPTNHDADACPICRALLHAGGLPPRAQTAVVPPPASRGMLVQAWRLGRTGSHRGSAPRAPPTLV